MIVKHWIIAGYSSHFNKFRPFKLTIQLSFYIFCFQPQTAVYLKENFLGAEEFCAEDVQRFEELKKCFESNNFTGVIERQIEVLGKSKTFVNSSLKGRYDICMET